MSLGKTSGAEARLRPRDDAGLLWAPLLAIASAAFAVEIPFFFFGTPSGHDVEFHLYSWLEVLAQWKHGIIYPRWAALAHFAYGEPRFVFYPPASWTLGALLSAIFPWTVASCIYLWIALVAAGVAMFVLVRRWLTRRDAIFVAVLYAANPYHLVIVYWRSAFAELLASCLVPLLLLCVLRAVERGRRAMVPLALVLAAAWLTNAPAAVMIHYSLALLLLWVAWQRRAPRLLLVGAGAVALGACLAAFYLLPAIYEQRWIDIAQAVSAGSRPADNFLFIHTTDADHDAFNRIVTWLAVLEMMVIVVAAWAARQCQEMLRELWNVLVAWAVGCSVLMFPVAAVLWKFLPIQNAASRSPSTRTGLALLPSTGQCEWCGAASRPGPSECARLPLPPPYRHRYQWRRCPRSNCPGGRPPSPLVPSVSDRCPGFPPRYRIRVRVPR